MNQSSSRKGSLVSYLTGVVSPERFARASFRRDAIGGVTAAVIALPMALTFGTVSGLGPEAGIYGAVIVGLVAAVFGGTRILISEPTGPMTVMMASIVAQSVAVDPEGGIGTAISVIVLAGVFQIVFGKLQLGRYITRMPYGVVSGFMSGIGVLLVFQQFPGMIGIEELGEGIPTLDSLSRMLQSVGVAEAGVGFGVFAVLILVPKRVRYHMPPQLLAVVLALLVSAVLAPYTELRTIGQISLDLPTIHLPRISGAYLGTLLLDAALLGLLGSIDTLLTATISDNLTQSHHDSNQELIGQGVGNIFSGLVGGLPGAGATMGTVVSIQSGARSPWVGVIRAVVLAVSVLLFAPVLSLLPMAALSAIAVKVGIDILDWSFLGRAHRLSRSTAIIMYLVLGLTVFLDLIIAVGVGVFIANILTIERLSRSSTAKVTSIDIAGDPVRLSAEERAIVDRAPGEILILELSGPMIFGVAQAIARESSAISSDVKALIIDLQTVPLLDTTISLALENVMHQALKNGSNVFVVAGNTEVSAKLQRFDLVRDKVSLSSDRLSALHAAQAAIGSRAPQVSSGVGSEQASGVV